jgi:hypothetical protein
MPNKEIKPQPKITFTLKPAEVTPAQREAEKRFWSKIISETKAVCSKEVASER